LELKIFYFNCNLINIKLVIWAKQFKNKKMDVAVIGVFIPIVAIIAISVLIIYLRKYENEERMSMIEKGINPLEMTKVRNTSIPLRFALLAIGIGCGLLIGYFLDRAFRMEEVAYFSMIFIFGGLGLGISYMIEEKKNKL
jgi:H+/Cl- antiporter ClcA